MIYHHRSIKIILKKTNERLMFCIWNKYMTWFFFSFIKTANGGKKSILTGNCQRICLSDNSFFVVRVVKILLVLTISVPCFDSKIVFCFSTEAKFKKSPENATVEEDQRHLFHCNTERIKGCTRNQMKIKWFHNGIKLTKRGSNFKIKKQGTTLLFDNIKVENRGEYYCSVSCKNKKFIIRGTSPKAYLQVEGILYCVHT